ncbi:MAG: redoxin domain-containing protein [Gemmatimonadetes bacterium]|nr:redoxin domain-containing protein [Gemmatimonadota bacterium]
MRHRGSNRPCAHLAPAPRASFIQNMNPLRTTTFAVAVTALLCLTPPGPPAGNLVFTPEAPPPGSTVTVTYHPAPADALVGERELVLRGHFRIATGSDWGLPARNMRIATLTPAGDGSFTASFTVPELASHGVFVVEDFAGERLDTNAGRHFDLLVHGEDKSSLADALGARAAYYRERDPATARQSAERAMELHLEVVAERNPGATVTVADRSIVLSGEDPERFELPPHMRWARIWERWEQDRNSRAALDDFEAEWPTVRDWRTGMSNSALFIAVQTLDIAAVDRWAARILDNAWTDPWSDKLMVARMISQIPVRRDRALELARGAMADLEAVDFARDPGRQLGQTAGEYAGVVARARADALVKHYRLLAEAGFEEESLDVLEAATAESAEPELFRRLAELRLAQGDSSGAAFAFAVVATDPGTLPAEARALAGRAGHSADSPEWHRLLDSATAAALPRALAGAVRRPLPPVRVADGDGERLALDGIVGGNPAVVVFSARWCGPCIEEIPEVARLAQALEPEGVRLVSVFTDDLPGPEMDAWLRDRRVTYPVYYDLEGDAWDAFGVEYIPAVFVLDANGLVRFEHSHIEGVWRQLEALGLLAGAAAR